LVGFADVLQFRLSGVSPLAPAKVHFTLALTAWLAVPEGLFQFASSRGRNARPGSRSDQAAEALAACQ